MAHYVFEKMLPTVRDGYRSLLALPPHRFLFIVVGGACIWSHFFTQGFLSIIALLHEYTSGDYSQYYNADYLNDLSLVEIVIMGPAVETFLYQFIVQNTFRSFFGSVIAFPVTVSLFSASHLFNNFANAFNSVGFGASLFLIYEYYRRRSGHKSAALFTFAIHAAWNGAIAHTLLIEI